MIMKFIKKKTYYPQETYEFNLPAGWSCPYAKDCKVCVDRISGKMNIIGKEFRCYASASERFPGVREHRWNNFDALQNGEDIILPKDAKFIRIHGSGDFYSQEYFDKWLKIAKQNPDVHFWAFTKSIQFWVNRLEEIPTNFVLTASYGSYQDDLIEKYNLKSAKVYSSKEEVPYGMKIDYDDSLAMYGKDNFALLDNFKNIKQRL